MKPFSKLVIFAAALSDAALVAAVLSGYGAQWGWWHFSIGFKILQFAVIAALFAAFLHLVSMFRRERIWGFSLFGLLFSLGIVALPIYYKIQASKLPRIHDITTDSENPPRFEAVLPLRAGVPNPIEYDPAVAAEQKRAYPDIQPLTLPAGPGEAFSKALDAAQKMGWQIVKEDSAQGVIEAVDTTRWFGFKDDVVIRLTPQEKSTRIDVRSVSRVGKSDVGANARRIRKYFRKLASIA